jgi:hypothetical protein
LDELVGDGSSKLVQIVEMCVKVPFATPLVHHVDRHRSQGRLSCAPLPRSIGLVLARFPGRFPRASQLMFVISPLLRII